MKKIAFYNDVTGFGGHEVMMLLIMRELVSLGHDIHLICSPLNRQLIAEAEKLAGVSLTILPFTLNRFNFLTNRWNLPKIGALRGVLRAIAPDCVVAVQGNIEVSSLVLPAARKERLPVLTYIALAQSMGELGATLPALRDSVDRYFLALPDRFVVISESQRSHLLRRGVAKRRIGLVANQVPFDPGLVPDKGRVRERLGMSREAFFFGLVGRVVANHKGHDSLVAAVSAGRERFPDLRFMVVGDGPDLAAVQQAVSDQGLSSHFAFIPWTDDMYSVYAALDAIVMPSNHEGVPLVMIEAGLAGLPVVASDIDGMSDYLPEQWLFPRGDIQGMVERMVQVSSCDQGGLSARVQERFRKTFLRQTIGREFAAEIDTVCRRA